MSNTIRTNSTNAGEWNRDLRRLVGLLGERASERGGEWASSTSQSICARRCRKELW